MQLEDFPMDAHACPLKFGSCKSPKNLLPSAHTSLQYVSFNNTKMPGDGWAVVVGRLKMLATVYPNISPDL